VGGRITVYNLGEQGVNLTKSPIHQSDGELLQSQNAIRSLNNVDGGLVKREALTALTSPAMDGAVRGLIGLPLPNPLATAILYAFVNGTGGAWTLCWHAGKLWVGTTGDMPGNPPATTNAGNVYSIRPFLDTSWTAETTLSLSLAESWVTSMASFLGDLYISTSAASGTAAKIRKRTPAGVWSTVYTSAHTAADNYITSLHAHDGALYAVNVDDWVAATQTDILRSTNGTGWSVDRDVTATDPFTANIPGPFLTIGDDLFIVMHNGNVLRRRSGTWSLVDSSGQNLLGPIAYIRPKN
jgi:hypothetical protein